MDKIKLGKDSEGKRWIATVDEKEYAGWNLFTFDCFESSAPAELRRYSYGIAIITTEPDELAKLHFIRVDRMKRNTGLGRMLLISTEEYIARMGIRKIWGEISNDPDLYQDDFPTLEDYLENIRTFYTRNGWSFVLYGNIEPDNPYIIVKVEKVLKQME